jgi:predicted site-specific integrase-resolvase
MNNKFVSSKEASKLLNVHSNTLRAWESKGLITTYRSSPTGQRQYDVEKFLRTQDKPDFKENICYCRVSSRGQKDDLKNQIEFLKKNYPNHDIISDIGSGLNYKRKGLKTLLDKALKGTIGQIVVTYKDRLCRFGFDIFEYIINASGGEILVLNHLESSPQEEMVKDLTSIIHVFSCRLYGLRRYKKDIKEACKEKEIKEDEEVSVL